MAEPITEQASIQPDTIVEAALPAPTHTPNQPSLGEADAHAKVIASLRSQVQDLFSQVTQLNNKLVQSYDRVADLEDNLHVTSSSVRQSTVKISQLELERTQHLAALDTGLLVEKSHVTAELTRLMEKATEEAAQRGQAETAKADIEKDLDDLSATLFGQANTMVAEARYARAMSERKVDDAELALKGAEEAIQMMQQQMQEMQAEKERAGAEASEMRALVGKGKWVERDTPSPLVRLRSSHLPYQEFLLFVGHLRTTRTALSSPPAMSTLLPLPFIARLLNEDSDPTVRLDLAPSLNWLSRRSVLTAIHSGQLMIEPMSSTTLLQETSSSSAPGASNHNISCALCGTSIFNNEPGTHSRPPAHPLSLTRNNSGLPWSTNLFKKPLASYSATNSATNSPPASPNQSRTQLASAPPTPQQVYIFRLASPMSTSSNIGAAVTASLPLTLSSSSTSQQPPNHPTQILPSQPNPNRSAQATIYPLCSSGYCLTRLRSTCSLWAFVRSGVVEKVWEEEVGAPLSSATGAKAVAISLAAAPNSSSSSDPSKPLLPPRRRGLWGMASALGERAASWGDVDREKSRANTPDKEMEKKLPRPPLQVHSVPPPLPKRADGRGRTRSATVSRTASPAPIPPNSVKPAVDAQASKVVREEDLEVEEEQAASEHPVTHFDVHEDHPEGETKPPATPAQVDAESSADTTIETSTPAIYATSPLVLSRRLSDDSFASAASEVVHSPTIEAVNPQVMPPPAVVKATVPETPTINRPVTPTQATVAPPSVPSTPSGAGVLNAEGGPSRTASPVPPPLPRRAAARARPVSVVPINPPAAAPETPTQQVKEAEAPTSITSVAPALEDSEVINKSDPEGSLPEEEATAEKATKAADPPLKPRDSEDDVFTEKAVVPAPDAASPNGIITADIKRVSSPPPAQEVGVSHAEAVMNGDVHQQNPLPLVESSKKSEGSTDDEAYIGESTWEERTWKELVKLKEDMFWARIGGLR